MLSGSFFPVFRAEGLDMMSGIKLPAMVIWKGVPDGRIDRECHGPLFAHDNVKHAVQVWDWVDSDKYQMWVREVLVPYLNG